MKIVELQREKSRSLKTLDEYVKLLQKGETVSIDVFVDSVQRYYDIVEAEEVFGSLTSKDENMEVGDLIKIAKLQRDKKKRQVNKMNAEQSAKQAKQRTRELVGGVLNKVSKSCKKASDSLLSQSS